LFCRVNYNYKYKIFYFRYLLREDAERAVNTLNKTMLDLRSIRVDWDTGFEEGRQFGRGWSGAQRRDDMTSKNDPERPRDNKFINHKKRRRDYDHSYDKFNKKR
jgi:hypothetical protein